MSANNEKQPPETNDKKQLPESLGDIPLSKSGVISLTVYLLSMVVLLLVLLYVKWPTCEFKLSTSTPSQPSNTNANGNDNRSTARSTTANVNQGATPPGNANVTPATGGASPLPATTTLPAVTANPSPPTTGTANQTPSKVEVLSVSPNSGPTSGERSVIISGSGFKQGLIVSFGGIDTITPEAVTAESILVKTPPHEPGKVEITVVNPDKGFKTLPAAYTYSCPPLPGFQVLLLVILAGGLGGTLHALRSFFWYVGNREFVQSWVLMYIFLPFTGAAIAAVFFFIFGAGFLTSPANVETPIYIVAVAALTGLFSPQAALKLQDIANAVLTKPAEGKDSKPQPSKPVGGNGTGDGDASPKINPSEGTVDGGTPVTITGVKYSKTGLKITIGGADATDINVVDSIITAKTPAHAKPETVDVIITSPEGPAIPLKYTYKAKAQGPGAQ
ncbi:MAG TPA: IPT/TIG domain-containing protein [Blastocatellia bacterium]|nr:IPT/TIG domain-containing protein [Blastocatellia bacterium]